MPSIRSFFDNPLLPCYNPLINVSLGNPASLNPLKKVFIIEGVADFPLYEK